jgi:hypothetical protein
MDRPKSTAILRPLVKNRKRKRMRCLSNRRVIAKLDELLSLPVHMRRRRHADEQRKAGIYKPFNQSQANIRSSRFHNPFFDQSHPSGRPLPVTISIFASTRLSSPTRCAENLDRSFATPRSS